jgi:hypothetical protein
MIPPISYERISVLGFKAGVVIKKQCLRMPGGQGLPRHSHPPGPPGGPTQQQQVEEGGVGAGGGGGDNG